MFVGLSALCRMLGRASLRGLGLLVLVSAAATAAPDASQPTIQLAQSDTSSDTTEPELAPVSSLPDSVTASFGDWQLRCQRAADPAVTTKICEVATVVVAQGQSQPFAQISVTKAAEGLFNMTALVPVNATLGVAPLVGTDGSDSGTTMPWLACTPGGCIANLTLSDEALARYRAYTQAGRLVFVDSGGNQIQVSFSFRGLAQALDAMGLEQITQ